MGCCCPQCSAEATIQIDRHSGIPTKHRFHWLCFSNTAFLHVAFISSTVQVLQLSLIRVSISGLLQGATQSLELQTLVGNLIVASLISQS